MEIATTQPFNEIYELIQSGEPQGPQVRRAGQLIKKRLAAEPQCAWALSALAELQFRLAASDGPITLELAASSAARAIEAQVVGLATSQHIGLNPVTGPASEIYIGAPYLTMAKVRLEYGDANEAMVWVHRALKLPHAKGDVLFVLARIAQLESRWDDAKASYQRCLEMVLSPQRRSNLLCWQADLLLQCRPADLAGARAASAQALSLDAENVAKLLRHGELLLSHTTDYEVALECGKRVLKLSQNAHGATLVALASYGLWARQQAQSHNGFQFGRSNEPQRGTLAGLSVADAMVLAAQRPAAGAIVEALLSSGQVSNINYLEPTIGRTALVGAAVANNLALARFLVARGASVHSLDRASGRNPLFLFAIHGNLDAVRWLHARGSDCHLLDIKGQTVVAAARAAAVSDDQKQVADIIALLCENRGP